MSVRALELEQVEIVTGLYGELQALLTLLPPSGSTTPEFTLGYDAVVHQVITHKALVSVRQNWMNGQIAHEGNEGVLLGVIETNPIDGSVAPLAVAVGSGSYWTGFMQMIRLGMTHIAAGTDHLLFLLVLLVPAPLMVSKGAYCGHKKVRASLWSITKIVTAFTIGHSATLVLAGLLHVELPQQPIEVLIAATIGIGAVHAFRPVFPDREAYVAGLFGLIHGMAFSFTLAEMDLSAMQLVLSLLGFNIGIELIQLLIVLAVMPALLMLARSPFYAPLRIGLAALSLLAAIGWAAARLGLDNPVSDLADDLGSVAPYLAGILTVIGLLAMLAYRRTGHLPS